MARAYADEGAIVVTMDIQDALGKKVADEINAKHPGAAKYYHCDVSKSREVKDAFAMAIDHLGGVDVMADVAGTSAMLTDPQDISEEQLDRILGINLKGTIFTNQAVYHTMKANGGGVIINFASGAAILPIGVADYGAAKGGVVSWTRHVAKAWGPDNIRVNSVCPSAVTWELPADLEPDMRRRMEEHQRKLVADHPLGRRGITELDVTPVMVFLATEAARYMTGQMFCVDGGYAMVR